MEKLLYNYAFWQRGMIGKHYYTPQTTSAIQGVAQQIVNCPYQGITKRMYLLFKVQELIALQVDPILKDIGVQAPPQLKKATIAQIHHAKDILLSDLENPPSLTQLAVQVGVSERTLQRGFRKLFGTTVFGYLTDKRMKRAEQFLREGKFTPGVQEATC